MPDATCWSTVPLSTATGGCSSTDMRAGRIASPARLAACSAKASTSALAVGARAEVEREREALRLDQHALGRATRGSRRPRRRSWPATPRPPGGHDGRRAAPTRGRRGRAARPSIGQPPLQERHRPAGDDRHHGVALGEAGEHVDGARRSAGPRGVVDDGGEGAVEVARRAPWRADPAAAVRALGRAGQEPRGRHGTVGRRCPAAVSPCALSLARWSATAGCGDGDGRVTIAFRPPVGYRARLRHRGRIHDDAPTCPARRRRPAVDRTRLDATQLVLEPDGPGVRVEVALSRTGIGTRTFVMRFDRAAQLTAVEEVEGIPAEALGDLGLSEIFPAAAGAPPEEPLAPGDRWTIDDEVLLGDGAPTRLEGEGRLVELGVDDGHDTATVQSTTALGVSTRTEATTGTRALDGEQVQRGRGGLRPRHRCAAARRGRHRRPLPARARVRHRRQRRPVRGHAHRRAPQHGDAHRLTAEWTSWVGRSRGRAPRRR